MGPLVTKQHQEKVKGYIDRGVTEGAKLVVDGRATMNAFLQKMRVQDLIKFRSEDQVSNFAKMIAPLIGAAPGEVAMMPNVSNAQAAILSALDGKQYAKGGGGDPAFNIARVRRDLGSQSTIGMLLADREDGNRFNRVGNLDVRYVFGGLYYAPTNVQGAFTPRPLIKTNAALAYIKVWYSDWNGTTLQFDAGFGAFPMTQTWGPNANESVGVYVGWNSGPNPLKASFDPAVQSLVIEVADGDPADVPASGYVRITRDKQAQVCKYTSATVDGNTVYLGKITPQGNTWDPKGKVADFAGADVEIWFADGPAALATLMLRSLESNGGATGGTYDVLTQGQGYGLTTVDEPAFAAQSAELDLTATVSAATLPPCPFRAMTLRMPWWCSDSTVSLKTCRKVVVESRIEPGNCMWYQDSVTLRVGATSTLSPSAAAWSATRSARLRAITQSVSSGMCGPCCSVVPIGRSTASTPALMRASTSCQVMRSIRCSDISPPRRSPGTARTLRKDRSSGRPARRDRCN